MIIAFAFMPLPIYADKVSKLIHNQPNRAIMLRKYQDISLDINQVTKLCINNTGQVKLIASNDEMPEHWQTCEGHILWITNQPNNLYKHQLSVKLASSSDVINNPTIRQGAIALASHVDSHRQQISNRKLKKLSEKKAHWAPTASNNPQKDDLAFGPTIENFLLHFMENNQAKTNYLQKIQQWFQTPCLCIEENNISITESRWMLTKYSIQAFKKRFNRMMERRIRLLNPILERHKLATISYMPLGFEVDCSPKRAQQKLSILIEVEESSFTAIITQNISRLAEHIASTPHHISELLQPLLQTVRLWNLLWQNKQNEIHNKVMIQLQALRLHPRLIGYLPRVEGILRKAEELLKNYQSRSETTSTR